MICGFTSARCGLVFASSPAIWLPGRRPCGRPRRRGPRRAKNEGRPNAERKPCKKAGGCEWKKGQCVASSGTSCKKQKKEKKCTKAGCAWNAKKEKCAKQKKASKCKRAGCKWKKSKEKCL